MAIVTVIGVAVTNNRGIGSIIHHYFNYYNMIIIFCQQDNFIFFLHRHFIDNGQNSNLNFDILRVQFLHNLEVFLE